MKNVTIAMLLIVVSVIWISGCSTLSVKNPYPDVKQVVDCITGENVPPCADGKCGEVLQRSLDSKGKLPEVSKDEYFEVLNSIVVTDKLGDGNNTRNDHPTLIFGYNPMAARIAKDALTSDSNQKIYDLFDTFLSDAKISKEKAGREKAKKPTSKITIDRKNFESFLGDVFEAHTSEGFSSFRIAAESKRVELKGIDTAKLRDEEKKEIKKEIEALNQIIEKTSHVDAYFKAYFRHGKLIKGTLKVSDLIEKIEKKIKDEAEFLSDEQRAKIIKTLFKKLTGKEYDTVCPEDTEGKPCEVEIAVFGKLEETQFVTRAGVEYGFPHITVSIDPLAEKKVSVTELDWNKIGAEVAKVYVEAIGDKITQLPADPRSTACTSGLNKCYTVEEDEKGEEVKVLEAEKFAAVNEHADKIDTLVSNAVGKAIRGASLAALNNEAIASIIESTIGTIMKKVAEKVAYCTYCYLSETEDRTMHIVKTDKIKIHIN